MRGWRIVTRYTTPEQSRVVQETRWCLWLGQTVFKLSRFRFEGRTRWVFERVRG